MPRKRSGTTPIAPSTTRSATVRAARPTAAGRARAGGVQRGVGTWVGEASGAEEYDRRDASVVGGRGEGDRPAERVADDDRTVGDVEVVEHGRHERGELWDGAAVGIEPGGGAVGREVDRCCLLPGGGEAGEDPPPGVGGVGEAVDEEDGWSVAVDLQEPGAVTADSYDGLPHGRRGGGHHSTRPDRARRSWMGRGRR